MRVGSDHDQAPAAGLAVDRRLGLELDPGGAEVVPEHLAELVVGDAADERRPPAERRDSDERVGSRAAGDLHCGRHRGVELLGACGVDQRHRAGGQVVGGEELVGLVAQNVDQRVPDPDNVEALIAHEVGVASAHSARG